MSSLSLKGRKKWLVLASILASIALVYLIILAVSDRYWAKRYAQGYPQIRAGDSKERVIGLMGRPPKTANCDYEAFPDKKEAAEYKMTCTEQYWYAVFLKDYVISFDREGRVINKTSAVSP